MHKTKKSAVPTSNSSNDNPAIENEVVIVEEIPSIETEELEPGNNIEEKEPNGNMFADILEI